MLRSPYGMSCPSDVVCLSVCRLSVVCHVRAPCSDGILICINLFAPPNISESWAVCFKFFWKNAKRFEVIVQVKWKWDTKNWRSTFVRIGRNPPSLPPPLPLRAMHLCPFL